MDAYALSQYEQEELDKRKLKWAPTLEEMKLLLIASTGFFVDAYDLFAINLIVPMLNYQMYGKLSGTVTGIALKGGVLKASANLGCILGQVTFGYLGDVMGRKAVYGKELMITIVATVLVIAAPKYLTPENFFTYITCFRVLMGIGIGGDYPMSAAVVSDRANLSRRGVMLSFIFSMQGWGNLAAGIVSIIVLSCFKTAMHEHHQYGQVDAVWRIITGIVLVPCLGTLVQRLLLPESKKFKRAEEIRAIEWAEKEGKVYKPTENPANGKLSTSSASLAEQGTPVTPAEPEQGMGATAALAEKKRAWNDFIDYFSEWKHLKTLIATAGCWFLVDITFYGINLNQSIVIDAIGLNKSKEPWQYLFDNTRSNLIITVAGFLPGYYLTMFTVEYIGRKWLQFGGFIMEAFFLGLVAGDFDRLKTKPAGFIVAFAFLQLFFNFGANATTFIIPAEVFPTRVRGFAHGFSAACGKVGAVIASLAFSEAAAKIGTANVLWIFFAISIAGAALTLLLPETKGRDADEIDEEERRAKGLVHNLPPADN